MPSPTHEEMDRNAMALLERLVEAVEKQTTQLAVLTEIVNIRLGEVRDIIWKDGS